jgi:hypothetical protein
MSIEITDPHKLLERLTQALEALEAQEDLSQRGIFNMTDEEVERVTRLRREALAR